MWSAYHVSLLQVEKEIMVDHSLIDAKTTYSNSDRYHVRLMTFRPTEESWHLWQLTTGHQRAEQQQWGVGEVIWTVNRGDLLRDDLAVCWWLTKGFVYSQKGVIFRIQVAQKWGGLTAGYHWNTHGLWIGQREKYLSSWGDIFIPLLRSWWIHE